MHHSVHQECYVGSQYLMFGFHHGLLWYVSVNQIQTIHSLVLIDRNGAIACLAMATVYVLQRT
jgi:hypothetical protein